MPAAAPPTPGPQPGLDPPGARSLRKNILFAVGGMGTFQACQFGAIVLLAKYAPSDVLGQVRLSLAIATPVIMFCSLELRGALVADAAHEFTFGTYRRLRSITMMIAAAVLLAVAVWEAVREQNLAYTIILAGMCASKIVFSLAEIGWGLFQKRERLDLMAVSVGLRGVAMIAAFGVFVPLYAYLSRTGAVGPTRVADGAALAITLYVIVSAALLFGFDRRRISARADYDPAWSWADVRRLARRTFPLGLVLLILHLCNSVPELILAQQAQGKAALGYFGALATITLAGSLLIFQSANAAANRLANYYQTHLASFLWLAAKLLGLAVAVGALSLAVAFGIGRWLLLIVFRADYAEYHAEFIIIVVAASLALLTNVFGVLTTQMRLFWLQVPAQGIVLVSTLIAALVLIPGAENLVRAGAWTLLIRAAVHVTLYAICVVIGILLRPRILASRVSLPQQPAGAGEPGPDW